MDSITCSTCLDEVSIGMKMVTNCSHQFHKDCAEAWLMQSLTCSYCRQLVDWVDLLQKEGEAPVWTLLQRITLEERGFEMEEEDSDYTQDDSEEDEGDVVCARCSEVLDLDTPGPVTATYCDGSNGCLAHIHIACMTDDEATVWGYESTWHCDYCTEIRRQDAETSQYETAQQASHHMQIPFGPLTVRCLKCNEMIDVAAEVPMTATHCEEFDDCKTFCHIKCMSESEKDRWREECKWDCEDCANNVDEDLSWVEHVNSTLITKCYRCRNRFDNEGEDFTTAVRCGQSDLNDCGIYVHVACMSDQERTRWNEDNHWLCNDCHVMNEFVNL
ncbi:unnamed protein product, partial [Mesorhabditis belari]|uniref:RING-type domain-containing protein n=1 Tax=Mesorhabditis belari TaxID=2138241 RepID=A0AAF3EIC3_9BILA